MLDTERDEPTAAPLVVPAPWRGRDDGAIIDAMKPAILHIPLSLGIALLAACNDPGSADTGETGETSDAGETSDTGDTDGCPLTQNTSETSTTNANGCHVLTRDTSACEAERMDAGLSGVWLEFSCLVSLSMEGGSVVAVADGRPDYASFYFPEADPCYEAWEEGLHNPNEIVTASYTVTFPTSPDATTTSMMMHGVVGLAVNGVPIYGNFAAPGDDIFQEALTFDKCDGHPQMQGNYHYHSEPGAITYDDANLVGVMLDGYPLYGRKDADGTYPTLDAEGGHTGVTADSPAMEVYHYHVNAQTSTNPQTMGETQWFLTTGTWHGTPGTCSGGC